jgi:hypothetical protein
MSYLSHYAARRPSTPARPGRGARVDERRLLNLPGFHGEAAVRVYVEDTTRRRVRRLGTPPQPRMRLRISDCFHEIALEFSVASADERTNSLHKINTLVGALQRFRDGLVAEADLAAHRERRIASPTRR